MARGYEDILALLTLFQMVFLIYPSGVLLVWIVIRWKNKKWTARTVLVAAQDKLQRAAEKRRAQRRSGEEKSWLDEDPSFSEKEQKRRDREERRQQKQEARRRRRLEKEFQTESKKSGKKK